MTLPQAYLDQMKALLGPDFDAYMASFDMPRQAGIRVNTSKISVEAFMALSPFDLEPIPWTRDGFYIDADLRPAKHPYYHAGLYYIQEPSAMAPASIMPIKPGDRVLDLCAAPGGKTLQLANAVGESGLVVSNDISASRLKAVVRNIELFGLKNVIVTATDIEQIKDMQANWYDGVLVDAPCSGEGMFRKDPAIVGSWHEASNQDFATIQKQLATQALEVLKDQGFMVYSTCTFSPVENEGVVAHCLDQWPTLKAQACDGPGFANGQRTLGEDLALTKRLYPFNLKGEGHYVALLKKEGLVEKDQASYHDQVVQPPQAYKDFVSQVLIDVPQGTYRLNGDKLYLEPHHVPNLKGVRVLRRGWLLGVIKKDRFEPAHSFAMGLKFDQIKKSLVLDVECLDVLKYLKCETLHVDVADGWYVVCVGNYPLGWAKVNKGTLKNKYPASLRMV